MIALSSYTTPRNARGVITMAVPLTATLFWGPGSASFDLIEGGMALPGCLCRLLAAVQTWSSTRYGERSWSRRWLGWCRRGSTSAGFRRETYGMGAESSATAGALAYCRGVYASTLDWYKVADSKGQLLLTLNARPRQGGVMPG